MASWREKLNQAAQNTISKSKEVAEIAKLNVEIGSSNQSMKNIYTEVGKYVLENGLLSEDASVAEWAAKAADIKAEIEASNERIKALKNVNTCPGCGAEVPKTSKFCDKCGTPIVVTSTEPVKEDEEIIDADFSEASQEEAAKAGEAAGEAQAAGAGCCCAEAQEPPRGGLSEAIRLLSPGMPDRGGERGQRKEGRWAFCATWNSKWSGKGSWSPDSGSP